MKLEEKVIFEDINNERFQIRIIDNEKTVIAERNLSWQDNKSIPSWVNTEGVGLDQFFTQDNIAQKYYNSFIQFLKNDKVDLNNCEFIEPSAGDGSFYNLLPKSNRLGLDVMPLSEGIIKQDFLAWHPNLILPNKKRIFIGNPPFGYRAWLALVFMNHAAKFADYIGFILPMAFQSDGKGSPKNRVKGMKLRHSEIIPSDSFYNREGKVVKVNALWQIWEKGENQLPVKKTCKDWLDLFTVDLRKERLCGMAKMGQADYFLQRTYYNEQPNLVKSFSQVKYVCGYGLIIKKDKDKVIDILSKVNWNNYSNLAAHNCRHISMYHIERVLTDKGLIDG